MVKHISYNTPLSNQSNIKTVPAVNTIKTGVDILDEFISTNGGFVCGSSIYLTGTAGGGKTTYVYTLQKLLKDHITSLYSREMSADSLRTQMSRYAIDHSNAYITDKDMCPNIFEYLKSLDLIKPKFIIIDSLQMIIDEDFEEGGNVGQKLKNVIRDLRDWARNNDAVLIVIGHVNKDGSFEGKNTIVHLFDAHLELIYDKIKGTRTLSWSKNRKGSIDKILHYSFGEQEMEFFTKEQYDKLQNNKQLEDFIFDGLKQYIDSLDKKQPNYKAFKNEFKKEIDEALQSNRKRLDMTLYCTKILHRKIIKFGIK